MLFVSATGTEVGKTFVTALLLRQLRSAGRDAAAIKPVMSGFDSADAVASDAGRLLAAMDEEATPAAINRISPWRFAPPLSPDMAATREGRAIPFDALLAYCRETERRTQGTLIVEGVGGAMVPLDEKHTVMDWMAALDAPALVVAGSYLGTISHCLTTLEAMRARGIRTAGLVLSESADSPVAAGETAATLARFTNVPIRIVPRLLDDAAIDAAPDLTDLVG